MKIVPTVNRAIVRAESVRPSNGIAAPSTPALGPVAAPSTPGFASQNMGSVAAGVAGAPTSMCCLCKEMCPACQMTNYGAYLSCKPCKSTYNRNLERMKNSAQLKAWWKGMNGDLKAQWYRDQKEAHVKHMPRKWDDSEAFNENRHYVRQGEDVIFDYVPLREWVKEERQLGFSTDEAQASFAAAWRDPLALTRLHAGIQHVAIYRGIREAAGKGQEELAGMRRAKDINDKSDLRAANELLKNVRAEMDDAQGVWRDNMCDGLLAENLVGLANSEERNRPRREELVEDMAVGLQEDLELQEARDAAQQDLDDNDDHTAAESARLKRPVGQGVNLGGRPKKSRIMVTALAMHCMLVCVNLFLCSFSCLVIQVYLYMRSL